MPRPLPFINWYSFYFLIAATAIGLISCDSLTISTDDAGPQLPDTTKGKPDAKDGKAGDTNGIENMKFDRETLLWTWWGLPNLRADFDGMSDEGEEVCEVLVNDAFPQYNYSYETPRDGSDNVKIMGKVRRSPQSRMKSAKGVIREYRAESWQFMYNRTKEGWRVRQEYTADRRKGKVPAQDLDTLVFNEYANVFAIEPDVAHAVNKYLDADSNADRINVMQEFGKACMRYGSPPQKPPPPTPTPTPLPTPTPTPPPVQKILKFSAAYDRFGRVWPTIFRSGELDDYLSEELDSNRLDVTVEFVDIPNRQEVIDAFANGEIHMAFFDGLSGIRARLQDPGSRAIVQRHRDQWNVSTTLFIINPQFQHLEIHSLEDLQSHSRQLTFTFGDRDSTAGHLIPRYYLEEAGIDPDVDFKEPPNFTQDSQDAEKTYSLVARGDFDVGVMPGANRFIAEIEQRVHIIVETPPSPFANYNWTVRSDTNELFENGFTDKIQKALLNMKVVDVRGRKNFTRKELVHLKILRDTATEKFIETNNGNYQDLEQAARKFGMLAK